MLKKKLLELRTRKNLTQMQLAQFLEISQPLIAGYENGKNASKKTLQKIADRFNISIDELLPEEDIKAEVFDDREYSKLANSSKRLPKEYKLILKDLILVFQRENRLQEERGKNDKTHSKSEIAISAARVSGLFEIDRASAFLVDSKGKSCKGRFIGANIK